MVETGVYYNGIAVFDFDSINIAAGTTLKATGALPLVLLSAHIYKREASPRKSERIVFAD